MRSMPILINFIIKAPVLFALCSRRVAPLVLALKRDPSPTRKHDRLGKQHKRMSKMCSVIGSIMSCRIQTCALPNT